MANAMTLENAVEIAERVMAQGWIDLNEHHDSEEWEAFRVLVAHGRAFIQPEGAPLNPRGMIVTLNPE